MAPDPTTPHHPGSEATLRKLMGGMSIFTMVMTVPQAWAVWVSQEVAGVSIWSWSAYLFSAVLWFWFGLKQGDRNIYLPCIGWIGLDAAVVAGVLVNG
jgi:uncharacterized protein with PQ loop repeat